MGYDISCAFETTITHTWKIKNYPSLFSPVFIWNMRLICLLILEVFFLMLNEMMYGSISAKKEGM